ncbi:MAG: methionyl-tRNA formyltransferase [Fidelibacterota bacterium]|nr:MAG: methionyl-tRNA formyltransferase [Candidatus Neomarinimicrobiota bacterium]
MRLVYMGTPLFANPSLQKLHESKHQVVAVVTGEDKPFGRGRKLAPPPVKELAQELGYPVLQPASLKDDEFQSHLADMRADLFVVVAFRILPTAILEIPPRGVVNVHPSLLPKFRGAAPIQHTLLAGETVTGVTTMAITPQIDAGNILMQRELPIHAEDDYGSLSDRLAHLGADLLVETLNGLEADRITPRPQQDTDEEHLSAAPKIRPEDLIIHWDHPARDIANQIRAFSPKPGAATFLDKRRLKLFSATTVKGSGEPGEVMGLNEGRLQVGTADGVLEAAEVQIEGHRRMTVEEFLRGTALEAGKILG